MHNRSLALVAIITLVLTLNSSAHSGETDVLELPSNPLQPFERLIGGQWHLDDTYQEFEWGVGRQSIRARSYMIVDGQAKLLSEGAWFWHPGLKTIKGVFTAIEMPVVFFDYTTRFEQDMMVNDLKAYAANGNETAFSETWRFVGENQFEWKLTSILADGTEAMMDGTYVRTAH